MLQKVEKLGSASYLIELRGHGGGGMGIRTSPHPLFFKTNFVILPNMIKTCRGEGGLCVISKDLKSSHQTGQTFHKGYNNDVQFPLCFSYSFLLKRDIDNHFSL